MPADAGCRRARLCRVPALRSTRTRMTRKAARRTTRTAARRRRRRTAHPSAARTRRRPRGATSRSTGPTTASSCRARRRGPSGRGRARRASPCGTARRCRAATHCWVRSASWGTCASFFFFFFFFWGGVVKICLPAVGLRGGRDGAMTFGACVDPDLRPAAAQGHRLHTVPAATRRCRSGMSPPRPGGAASPTRSWACWTAAT